MPKPTFSLNPFAFITETDNGYLICTSPALRILIAKDRGDLIQTLVSKECFTDSELQKLFPRTRIKELKRKHILLTDHIPPLSGRYSRQLGLFSLVSDNCYENQARIEKANVLLLGAGGVGSHVLWNLASMGVKKATVIDFDRVEETNLNRQLYKVEDIGRLKVEALCESITKFNPDIELTPVNLKLQSKEDIEDFIKGKTLVVRAIDTPMESMDWVNEVCVKHGVPAIGGGFMEYMAAIGPIYIPGKSLCTACLNLPRARRVTGVGSTLGPITTMVASYVALYSMKIMLDKTDGIIDRIYYYNTLIDQWETVELKPVRPCSLCGHGGPAQVTAPPEGENRLLWVYRLSLVGLIFVATALRVWGKQQLVGVLVVTAVILSVPILDLLCKDPQETRRQIFVTSCLYSILALVLSLAQNLITFVHASGSFLDRMFSLVQQGCVMVLQMMLVFTVLFALMNLYMNLVYATTHKEKPWLA